MVLQGSFKGSFTGIGPFRVCKGSFFQGSMSWIPIGVPLRLLFGVPLRIQKWFFEGSCNGFVSLRIPLRVLQDSYASSAGVL